MKIFTEIKIDITLYYVVKKGKKE